MALLSVEEYWIMGRVSMRIEGRLPLNSGNNIKGDIKGNKGAKSWRLWLLKACGRSPTEGF